MESKAASLLTFAPMIDSECCRFLLTHYGVAFREEARVFGWGSILAFFRSGSPQVPLFSGAGLRATGPKPLAAHFEALCAPEKRLTPAGSADQAQVEKDWQRFNSDLGIVTAVLGYYHLLPHRDIMIEPFTRGVPAFDATLTRSCYGLLAAIFKLLLRLNAQHAREALDKVRAIFLETDLRLADGRQYLVGGQLTLADIALATSAAPVLLPDLYGSPMPPLESMPPELKAIVAELQQHPTARFVEAIFAKHRRGG